MSRVALFVSCFVALFFSLSFAHAQTVGGADPFTVDISPQYPAPYQTVTLTPGSTSFDIAGAAVTVTVNGASFYKGSGGMAVNVPLGGPGSTANIVVTATSAGQSYSKKISLHPASVALVEEPVSTTHPFYPGGSLVTSEGRVRLIAIPDLRTSSGKALDPATLIYSWKQGDQALDSDSGIGQSILDASAPQRYRDATVSVTVASQDGSMIAQAQTTVSPVDPLTRIYQDDPLLGPLFDNALAASFTMPSAEDTFLGVPYYFSSTPAFAWTMNSQDSGATPDITVRSTGSGTGTAVLDFSATNANSAQSANSTVSVSFGQSNSTGLFGL